MGKHRNQPPVPPVRVELFRQDYKTKHWLTRRTITKTRKLGRVVEDWSPVIYPDGPAREGVEYTVLAGFVSDGSSNKRLLWWFASPWQGKHTEGAVLHDDMYYKGLYSKAQSDAAFLDVMRRCGVMAYKRQAMYRAVSWFGGGAWKKHRQGKHPHGEGS